MTASDFLVSVGVADIGGEQLEGVGLHRKGESSVWFLPSRAIGQGSSAESSWVRVRNSAYRAAAGPIDEQVIAELGISGHRYVVEVPKRNKSSDTR